jgi:signal transduction histidine kinase
VFNIKEAVEKVMSIQRQKAINKDLEFNVEFINIGEDGGGFENESPMICCDEHRIMQVLLGLQTNALKFTQKGRVYTTVEIIASENNQKYLKISVIDTGIGIAKKN